VPERQLGAFAGQNPAVRAPFAFMRVRLSGRRFCFSVQLADLGEIFVETRQ
jgi:hypothetical protein